ncbi:flagellar assembly protein FliT [Ureibacillus sp. MALMAid1270]|uniref:flagellar assembly protein FliT n=1 Tax=Ureibacillus sp. MALMAid1270 TaxID=3411629 RepID=UPI003BA711B6
MIRESLLVWKQTTDELIQLVELGSEKLREDVIKQVEELLNKRDELQPLILPPFSDDENNFGKSLVEYEKLLDTKLKIFLNAIRKDMQTHKKKKDSLHAYLDPYSKVYKDGTFYDKKK